MTKELMASNGMKFIQDPYSDRSQAYTLHGEGAGGFIVVRNVHDVITPAGQNYIAIVSHWLSDREFPEARILQFTLTCFETLEAAIEGAASVTFQVREFAGMSWIVASTGHAAAMDHGGNRITVTPPWRDDGWGWQREHAALGVFAERMGAISNSDLSGRSLSQDEAMIAAVGAKERLRGAVAELAAACGIIIVS